MHVRRVLITGAGGRVGTVLRAGLGSRALRLLDRVRPAEAASFDDEFVLGDLIDPVVCRRAVAGMDAVVHLAAFTKQGADWPDLISGTIITTQNLLDAAAAAGVRRFVLASSVHAAGALNDPDNWPVRPELAVAPCCPYGISKAVTESLVARYPDLAGPGSGATVLRFALTTSAPRWTEEARAWLSDHDLAGLVSAALDCTERFGIHFGASECPHPRYDLTSSRERLGWSPQDIPSVAGLDPRRHSYPHFCRLWRLQEEKHELAEPAGP